MSELDLSHQPEFDGSDYISVLDKFRLTGQIRKIFNLMQDGRWRTLREIEVETGYPQASISAQLRHLRKAKFGSHIIEKRKRGYADQGLFEYQLNANYFQQKLFLFRIF